jgi:hypothetical protein
MSGASRVNHRCEAAFAGGALQLGLLADELEEVA